ncbi:PP2C family protein-serine/threonine phosphatase [Maridesulfovibrio salexigens]|uniref:Response regulator receiver protein n=1 Tax=Maridesulfovibrio salexigens (strain ATCC 14822 / DSM 2638 / NCIMB 8403 / VKM B-1763) TaxID=526222 RepID=C6C148_MARSD|nr:fused response regulator/phosphatase [Maridesulfovibrio salexigens]ACS79211.1 response regulator receiver protein [Maridesulfovibrio salexigens DSM 2638]
MSKSTLDVKAGEEIPKILVVDDSATMRNFLTRVLEGDYDVETASDGLECIAQYMKVKPSVILLDLLMPGMDGFDVIDKIRNVINDQEVIIIVLTGQDEQEIKARALNSGANDYLTKPFHVVELKARVGVAIRQVMLTRQLQAANKSLQRAYDIIDDEVKLVARLQDKLLPTVIPVIEGLDIKSMYRPSGRASGDYYDVFGLKDGVVRVIMADVSGHGPQAAFIMAIVRTLFKADGANHNDLAESLNQINEHLLDLIGKDSYFVTLFAADIDFNKGVMKYMSAGHCPALAMLDGEMSDPLVADVPPLGFFPVNCVLSECRFTSSLRLFLFTDGCYEWRMNDDFFSLEPFVEIAEELMLSNSLHLDSIEDILEEKTGVRPVFDDDVTALSIDWSGSVVG